MKTKPLASLALLTSATALLAAGDADSATKQLQVFPKNLARQHVGTNLFLFNPTNQNYAPTEAAASWLDDDVTTGWPVMAGKQHYLLTLAEPTLVSNFSLSTRTTAGTVTLYASDEPAAPGAKSWSVLAKDVQLDSVNQKKLAKGFSRIAKYVLIETDIADPGPLFSLYVYGDRAAVNYDLRKRETPINIHAIFGPYVNDRVSYNVAGLYAHSAVTQASSPEGFLSWQKAIDDNPESSLTILPTTSESGLTIQLGTSHRVNRFAVLTDAPAKGQLDFFVVPSAKSTEVTTSGGEVGDAIVKVSNPRPTVGSAPVNLTGLTPSISMVLDGSTTRSGVDLPAPVEGAAILVRWTPTTAGESISLKEINAFNDISLSEYDLSLTPAAVADLGTSRDYSKDGKDYKDPKAGPPPVGEFFPQRSPYLPGGLGFPPNLGRRGVQPPTPLSF